MTVNKSSSTTKSKKKTAAGASTSSSSTTTTSTTTSASVTTKSKSSKVESRSSTAEEIVQTTGTLSQYPSGSCLQISDVSHLPLNASSVSYTVTEKLPQETGEKITTYSDGDATSTEYVHYVTSDTSKSQQHSSNIVQISSILNRSTSNLSTLTDDSSATYTVMEPKEEVKYIGKSDAAWNGKFIHENPIQKIKDSGAVVEEHFSSSSKQQSSSVQKSSSSSYVIEIVDGKERIVDQKHHESGHSKSKSNEEHLSSKQGTNIVPEIHYVEKGQSKSTAYDTSIPELQQPKSSFSEYGQELHKVGEIETSSSYRTHDKDKALPSKSTKPLDDKPSPKRKPDTNWDGTFVLEKSNKAKQTSSDSRNFYATDATTTSTAKKADISSSRVIRGPTSTTTTTTTTYYDASGNVIKMDSQVDNKITEGNHTYIIDDASCSDKTYVVDNASSSNKTYTIDGNNDDSSSSKTYYVGERNVLDDRNLNIHTTSDRDDASSTKTYVIDDNRVDTSKIRNAQTTTDSRNFYGHGMDASGTVVRNVYDTSAIQNTIGTKGRILKDETINTTDVIYSNERNYGKTGWNGKFIYETPQQPIKKRPSESPTRKTIPSPTKASTPKDGTKKFIDSERIDSYQEVIDVKDSKSVVRDSKTFIDQESNVERFTSDIKRGPRDGSPRRPRHGVPKGPRDGSPRGPQDGVPKGPLDDSPRETRDGVPKKPRDASPRGPSKGPRDGSPRGPRDGTSKRPQDRKRIPTDKLPEGITYLDSTDVTESYESVTNVLDYKTSTIDSKTFVDNQTIKESYDTTVTGLRPKDRPRLPDGKQPTDSRTVIESYETVTNQSDYKTTVLKDSQSYVDNQTSFEHYTTTDKYDSATDGPRGPKDKPKLATADGKKPLEDVKKKPKDLTPTGKYPKDLLETDSKTVVETYETVTNQSDYKTTLLKDSQTFVDNQTTFEHYTTTDKYDSTIDGPKRPDRPGDRPKQIKDHPSKKPTEIIEDFRSEIIDDKNLIEITDIKGERTTIKDVKNIDVVDRVHIDETIVDIKDIVSLLLLYFNRYFHSHFFCFSFQNEVENITRVDKYVDNKVINIVKTIKEPQRTEPRKYPLKEQCICELCTCG